MANTPTLKFKRGDDFKLDFTLTDQNNQTAIDAYNLKEEAFKALNLLKASIPQDVSAISAAQLIFDNANLAYENIILMDISGWGIASQIRWCGRLIGTFTIDDSEASIGKFSVIMSSAETALWEPRKYDVDIQFTRLSGKVSSETFIVDVQKDITNV